MQLTSHEPTRPQDYANLLARLEARRRAADDVVLRHMKQVLEPRADYLEQQRSLLPPLGESQHAERGGKP